MDYSNFQVIAPVTVVGGGSFGVQIERIVTAKQTAGDRVGRNRDRARIAGEEHRAMDGAVFERNGRRALTRRSTWAGVAYVDAPVDHVTQTAGYFFWANEEFRRHSRRARR